MNGADSTGQYSSGTRGHAIRWLYLSRTGPHDCWCRRAALAIMRALAGQRWNAATLHDKLDTAITKRQQSLQSTVHILIA